MAAARATGPERTGGRPGSGDDARAETRGRGAARGHPPATSSRTYGTVTTCTGDAAPDPQGLFATTVRL